MNGRKVDEQTVSIVQMRSYKCINKSFGGALIEVFSDFPNSINTDSSSPAHLTDVLLHV